VCSFPVLRQRHNITCLDGALLLSNTWTCFPSAILERGSSVVKHLHNSEDQQAILLSAVPSIVWPK
jgi:hypothetical protein